MALTAEGLRGTGKYASSDSKRIKTPGNQVQTHSFFSGLLSVGAEYSDTQAEELDPSILDFGTSLVFINIENTGSTWIAFQWRENWGLDGDPADNGLIGPGKMMTLEKTYKTGVRFRCAEVGGTGTVFIWGY